MGDNFILSSIKPIKNTVKKHKKNMKICLLEYKKISSKKELSLYRISKIKKKLKLIKKIKPPNNGTGFV